jgi:hypothetical protein
MARCLLHASSNVYVSTPGKDPFGIRQKEDITTDRDWSSIATQIAMSVNRHTRNQPLAKTIANTIAAIWMGSPTKAASWMCGLTFADGFAIFTKGSFRAANRFVASKRCLIGDERGTHCRRQEKEPRGDEGSS